MGRIIKAAELAGDREPSGKSDGSRIRRSDAFVDEAALQKAVVSLAAEMTRRIIGKTVEQDPAVLEEIYGRALGSAGMIEGAVIRIHPDDRKHVASQSVIHRQGCSIVDDPVVGRGGYRLTADFGEIDGSIETLLNIFNNLTKASS